LTDSVASSSTNVSPQPGANTLAEIFSEPTTWAKCIAALDETGELRAAQSRLSVDRELVFVGCGSSYYLALTAAATWSLLTGGAARAMPASEILLFPELLPRDCGTLLISRSGHTSEIIEAGRYLQSQNRRSALAITCGTGTPLEAVASATIRLPLADEKSTVMTRSFSSMLLALQLLAAEKAGATAFAQGLRSLPSAAGHIVREMDSVIRPLASSRSFEDYVFLGQGPFFGIAQEAMLKVKEMSCSYAQCFHTLEFRHGPKAIVSPETLVTFFLSESGFDSEVSVLEEIKELGAVTLVITNRANAAVREAADVLIETSLSVPEAARAAAFVIPGQLLGFHTGIRKGFDPDHPRHLSRVVMLQNERGGDPGRGAA
jgi:glucosamine--fructose-6-phosphate aminotransferase (isomerizing)